MQGVLSTSAEVTSIEPITRKITDEVDFLTSTSTTEFRKILNTDGCRISKSVVVSQSIDGKLSQDLGERLGNNPVSSQWIVPYV